MDGGAIIEGHDELILDKSTPSIEPIPVRQHVEGIEKRIVVDDSVAALTPLAAVVETIEKPQRRRVRSSWREPARCRGIRQLCQCAGEGDRSFAPPPPGHGCRAVAGRGRTCRRWRRRLSRRTEYSYSDCVSTSSWQVSTRSIVRSLRTWIYAESTCLRRSAAA